ncbi:MAG: PAS domain-containing protein [Pseudomonadota bacterium]
MSAIRRSGDRVRGGTRLAAMRLAIASLLPSAMPTAFAASPAGCVRTAFASMPTARCEDLAAADIAALLARFDGLRGDDDLAGAERVLSCAAPRALAMDDPRSQYELVRRAGILEYDRDRPSDALAAFECAQQLADALADRAAAAKQWKNIGSSLRRIGDYAGAMRALSRSLRMLRESGDPGVGPVLNNIADVYRDMEQDEDAERYYRDALRVFRAAGDTIQAAHVYDSLSEIAFERSDAATAIALLDDALRALREEGEGHEGARRYRLMLLAGRARAAIAGDDLAQARASVEDGLALAAAHALPIPVELQLEAARVERLSGRAESALARLRGALADGAEAPGSRAALLRETAATLEAMGRGTEAMAALREAHAREVEDLRAQRDRGLAWSNARFNLNESRRRIAEVEAENRRRSLMLWLTVVSAIAALSLLSLYFLRHRQRARLAEAARRARYEQALEHYRREADALAEDRRLLQALLDSRDDALALLDAEGQVLAVNRAACALLGQDRDALSGRALSERLDGDEAERFRAALERMEDAQQQILPLTLGPGGRAIGIELRPWEHGDGLIVIALHPDARASSPVAAEAAASVPQSPRGEDDEIARFRRDLVALMLAVIEAWESSTGLHRIELAERSRIWCVGIDDGRLRARAMERYLSLSKLPRNPRWRDVLRSAYFVLGHCEKLAPEVREALQSRIDGILAMTRREALA